MSNITNGKMIGSSNVFLWHHRPASKYSVQKLQHGDKLACAALETVTYDAKMMQFSYDMKSNKLDVSCY